MKHIFSRYPKISFALAGALLIVLTAGISFCGKRKCGGFVNPNFDNWFPYQENDQYNFLSNLGNRDTFRISRSVKSTPYETSGGFHSAACSASADILGSSVRGLFLNIDAWQSEVDFSVFFTLDNLQINSYQMGDSGMQVRTSDMRYINNQYFSSKTIGNQNFTAVQELTIDTNIIKSSIQTIWLSKKRGLVAFEKRSTKEVYVLQ